LVALPGGFEHLLRRPVLVDYALVHEEDARAHIPGELHFVRHDEHRHSFAGQLADYAEHFAHHRGVQGRRGFVKQDYLRLHGQAAGDGHALLLAAGKGGRIDIGLFGQPHLPKEGHAFFPRFFQADLADFAGGEHHVFQHRHVVEKVEVLEHHPHLLPQFVHRVALLEDVFPVHDDASTRGRIQQVQRPEEGALPRSGRADDADYLAGMDFTVHVLEYLEALAIRVVVGFAEVGNGNHSTFLLGIASLRSRPMSQTRRK
jgi:hypothetical protein